ncbi:MAG: hypothetical protein KGZ66_09710 [Selenomonadales bacterium]|nr:hypothetical protein [Selenomonadales bacterium]
MNQGDWVQLNDTGAIGKVLEVEKLWGETLCRVWLLESDTVVSIPAARLKPLDGASGILPEKIAYVAAAAAGSRRIMPLFLADNGLVFLPTAKYVWDQLLATTLEVTSLQSPRATQAALARLNSKALELGRPIYEALKEAHFARLARERQKAAYAFAARQKSILRVGLPQVRAYRLNLLAQEEHEYAAELAQMAHIYPELVPLLILRVGGS